MGKTYRRERSDWDGEYAARRNERNRKKDKKFADREDKRQQKERSHEQVFRPTTDDEGFTPRYEKPRPEFRSREGRTTDRNPKPFVRQDGQRKTHFNGPKPNKGPGGGNQRVDAPSGTNQNRNPQQPRTPRKEFRPKTGFARVGANNGRY